jgi:KDO2-lipid IV(A) lauroyltransferase
LKKHQIVGFAADRDINGSGYPVRFFGKFIRVPRGPAEVAARSGAPIVPAFFVQEKNGFFKLHLESPIEVDGSGPVEEKVNRINQTLVEILERFVSRYPTQWFAFYRVWN